MEEKCLFMNRQIYNRFDDPKYSSFFFCHCCYVNIALVNTFSILTHDYVWISQWSHVRGLLADNEWENVMTSAWNSDYNPDVSVYFWSLVELHALPCGFLYNLPTVRDSLPSDRCILGDDPAPHDPESEMNGEKNWTNSNPCVSFCFLLVGCAVHHPRTIKRYDIFENMLVCFLS